MKIKVCENKTTTTEYHTASNVARKATAFPLWRAMDSHWNRNTVSLIISIILVSKGQRLRSRKITNSAGEGHDTPASAGFS